VQADPFNAVGGPEADAVAFADAERPESARNAVGLLAELRPGEAARLMAGDDGVAVRKARGGAMEQVADGEVEEGAIGAAGLAGGGEGVFDGHSGKEV